MVIGRGRELSAGQANLYVVGKWMYQGLFKVSIKTSYYHLDKKFFQSFLIKCPLPLPLMLFYFRGHPK